MATSTRLQALSNLADKVPQANAKLARQRQQAQQLQMKQQIAGADVGALNMNVAQQAGAQAAQIAGQGAVQAQQSTIQQQGQIGQLKIGEQKLAGQQKIADKEALIEQASIHLANKLNQIDMTAKQKVFDERMAFSSEQAQQGYLQQRQLADFAILSARSREQYLDNAQKVEQWNKKQLQIMEDLHNSIMSDLKGVESLRELGLDQAASLEAEKMLAAYTRRIEREKAKANNNRAMWVAGGTIVGAVIGGVFTLGAGAPAGAAIGGALGAAAAGSNS